MSRRKAERERGMGRGRWKGRGCKESRRIRIKEISADGGGATNPLAAPASCRLCHRPNGKTWKSSKSPKPVPVGVLRAVFCAASSTALGEPPLTLPAPVPVGESVRVPCELVSVHRHLGCVSLTPMWVKSSASSLGNDMYRRPNVKTREGNQAQKFKIQ